MRKLLYVLFLFSISVCNGQNCVLTHSPHFWVKNEINVLKILLDVYGDSVTNAILMGQVHIPGPVYLGFNGMLELDSIGFWGDWKYATKTFKQRMEKSIKKHTYFIGIRTKEEVKHLTDSSRYSAIPFTKAGFYSTLISMPGYIDTTNGKVTSNNKAVDYAKKRIAEVDSMYIEDVYGNIRR